MTTPLPPGIALDPADWFLAGWRKLPPLSLPEPRPFDPDDCLRRLARVKGASGRWNWAPADILPGLTAEEARFWLWAMVHASASRGTADLAARMARQVTDGPPADEEMLAGLRGRTGSRAQVGPELAPVIWSAFPPEEVLRRFGVLWPADDRRRRALGSLGDGAAQVFCAGFLRWVRPYLRPEELLPLQRAVGEQFRRRFEESRWVPHALAHLARALDLHDEMGLLVASWRDGRLSSPSSSGGSDDGLLLFGLGDPDAVLREMRRLSMQMQSGDAARAFLAHTGTTALPTLRDHVLAAGSREIAEELAEVLCLVQTAEAAPLMLELTLSGKATAVARRWLEGHAELATAALLPLACESGKLADPALAFLSDVARGGNGLVMDRALAQAGEVPQRVRTALADVRTAEGAFDDDSLPAWFLAARPAGKARLPRWLDPAAVAPVSIAGRRLAPDQVASAIGALKDSTLAAPAELVAELKKHADGASLDAFAWDLFERWQLGGAPAKDRWAMSALGLLGGDGVCRRLAPVLRDWPAQGQHKRAAHGLECLRAIAGERALLELHRLAEQVKSSGLEKQARRFVEEIAAECGLTPAQMEDRLVPDLGLDEQGTRLLDCGGRRFRVTVGPDLKPRLLCDDGSVQSELPRAGDDPAREARAEWDQFKVQLRAVAKAQAERLEQGMIRRRRWGAAEMEQHVLRHPLMRALAQVLLWAGFDEQGRAVKVFRVREDQTCADLGDRPVTLDPQWGIGIVHPALLPAGEVAAWSEVLARHGIVPPFPQLARPVFRPGPAEAAEKVLKRFAGAKVQGAALLAAAKSQGWEAGRPTAEHRITRHRKRFPEAGVTALLSYRPGLEPVYSRGSAEEQELDGCCFVPSDREESERAMPLGSVDVLVLSEAAALLQALVRR
jgi:hypothetical protein